MAVNFTLRDPNPPMAITPEERIADQALVNPFVILQSNQVKRTPQDSISELIIWKMNR